MIFKCKMCGAALEVGENATVAVCEYCESKQTLPKLTDEKKANLYDRANHFRRNNDYDKAMGIYEQILSEDNTDAEAYWSLILCKYGIEYVEDPATRKRVPTVNRAQFTSVLADADYKSAIEYADAGQRTVYEAEAKAIDEIQKGILAISQKEKPFDVFICYKETDNQGRRTPDSVLATELYHGLTNEGFKVFFARITLEDKLGTAYEPYIFAALNSAKVMVVLGTNPEYFNAVWVKNEWKRYLALIKKGEKKILIPAYKDMDPYDLPEEFSHLQAQDMSKLGFMQDLIRGIKKIAQVDTPKATVVKETVISGGNANTAPLLKRAFMFLEDGDWNSANEYCEKVLDIDPENVKAYLGKLLSELEVSKQEDLKDQAEPFDENNNYLKILRFGDDDLRRTLVGYIEHIETSKKEAIYVKAKERMANAKTPNDWDSAGESFKVIAGYKDADALSKQCFENEENARLEGIYTRAKNAMSAAKTESDFKETAALFESISEYEDSAALANECCEKAKKIADDVIKSNELFNVYRFILDSQKSGKNAKALAEEKARMLTQHYQRCLAIRNNWNVIESNIALCNREIQNVQTEITKLYKEKAVLSIFSAKRKNEISAEIMGHEEKFRNLRQMIADNEAKKGGFSSLVTLDNEISHIKEEIYKQNKMIDELSAVADIKQIREELSEYAYGKELLEKYGAFLRLKPGDIIKFGSYQKARYGLKENIEWIVLEKRDEKALVISKYALDCKPYNTSETDVTWETCTLRSWLNNDFINAAFSDAEKAMIYTVTVLPDKNPKYSKNPGNATRDQVFLLSITEANKYFISDSARQCKPTDYAVSNGVYVDSGNGNCWWWLRTYGLRQYSVASVHYFGDVFELGSNVVNDFDAVRPALWINLESVIFKS